MPTATQIQPLSSRLSIKKKAFMTGKNTVSADAIQAEWGEIQLAQQNPAMFRPLYSRYYEPIFRFIFRRTSDEMLTGDLCAQVFLKAMQKLKNYQFKGVPFSAWLYRIASNEVAQHFRDIQKNRVVSIEENSVSDMMEEVEMGDLGAHRQLLIDTLNDMKDEEVQLIEMRFFEHRAFKEIADILGITESNAKVKTYRLLEKMKKRMQKQMKR
jgi:RNA polymerase sigma-70 factor (ECF subfamily)